MAAVCEFGGALWSFHAAFETGFWYAGVFQNSAGINQVIIPLSMVITNP